MKFIARHCTRPPLISGREGREGEGGAYDALKMNKTGRLNIRRAPVQKFTSAPHARAHTYTYTHPSPHIHTRHVEKREKERSKRGGGRGGREKRKRVRKKERAVNRLNQHKRGGGLIKKKQ